ncbi:MAG TPA: PaaI family thioesterase [Acidimicrobiales bacterium]|nr:PaaI family thioesterase [Acidimicrobiales bacterium]
MIPQPVVTVDELNDFLWGAFPTPRGYRVDALTERGARLVMPIGDEHQRPGGTVSGPTMMGLTDGAAWLATLSRVGIVPLAVTSTLTIHFLEKPALVDLVAEAELLRLGARSSVTEVRITSGAGGPVVAIATVGYSIPA